MSLPSSAPSTSSSERSIASMNRVRVVSPKSVATLFACALSFTVLAENLRFTSEWWQVSIHDEERTGFVLGYFDCPRAPKTVRGASSGDYIAFVSGKIASANKARSIPTILDQAHRDMHPFAILRGGEEYPERHGWLDGEWWGDAEHGNRDEKAGYVEGYLACELGSTSRSHVQRLTAALNQHFKNPRREHDKIGDVLQPLLDHERQR